jgi:hypothetical protein
LPIGITLALLAVTQHSVVVELALQIRREALEYKTLAAVALAVEQPTLLQLGVLAVAVELVRSSI